MNHPAFVYTYTTRFGTFRVQPHKEKWGLFFDYPNGQYDLLTPCQSPDDALDYVEHQDTGISDWDDTSEVPDSVRHIENWQRAPFQPKHQ